MSGKCCKKPECKSQSNKCGNTTEFYNDPMFWKFLLFLNVLIILIRYNYIKCKDQDFNLIFFLLWLQLQIIVFFIVMSFGYYVLNAIIYLIGLFYYYLKALFTPRKTSKIMSYLNLKKTDEFFFRLYCIFGLFFTTFLIFFILGVYAALFFHSVFFVLGYTKI